jgi:hypothetical protein
MSIHSPDFSGHITITAPGATSLVQGARTVGVLMKTLASLSTQVWFAYEPANFSQLTLYFDGDMWESFKTWDANLDISTPIWRWLVVSRGASAGVHRAHAATLTSSGALSWTHADFDGSRPNFNPIDRFSIGDEFGTGFRGDMGVLAAFTSELDDAGVESVFARSSADILAANPQFFVHFPEADGADGPFTDLAGAGVETIHTGSWTASDDPDGYSFSLGRSGQPKIWNGSSWVKHQAKTWTGSLWVPHAMKGHDGSSFVASK